MVTAENDGPVCTFLPMTRSLSKFLVIHLTLFDMLGLGGGNCLVTSLGPDKTQLDTLQLGYPAVAPEDFATFVVPGDGHGINFRQFSVCTLVTSDTGTPCADDRPS